MGSPAKNSRSRMAVPQSLVMVNLILHLPERFEMAETEALIPVPDEGVTATMVDGDTGKITQETDDPEGGVMFKLNVPVVQMLLFVALMTVNGLMGT